MHLARAANGISPLRTFLESYVAHRAGIDHDLVIVLKGFGGTLGEDYAALLRPVRHTKRHIDDRGFDIDAYFGTARELDYESYCFLNSFSVIQADEWLGSLARAVNLPNVGVVGATGSWQSNWMTYEDPVLVAQARARVWWLRRTVLTMFPFLRTMKRRLYRRRLRRAFKPFPNHHIRTNAFMVRREVIESIRVPPMRQKFDAYVFESGRTGLTQQVLAMGRRALVVSQDGGTFEPDDWYLSNTFWRKNQPNLLVSDNQTRAYDASVGEPRRYYSWLAWGPQADPGPGT